MAKELLKEAIADAKAVREVALENAKSALEEAFTPKIKSMLSAKISEEIEDTQEGMEYESTENDVYSEGELDEDEDNLEEDLDLEEDDENLNITDDSEGDIGATENTSMDEEIDLEEILNELEALEEEGGEEKEEEYVDEEIDVNALLEELNLDEEVDLTEIDMEEMVGNAQNEEKMNEELLVAAGLVAVLVAAAGGIEAAKKKWPKFSKALDAVGSTAGPATQTGTRQESISEVEVEVEEEFKEMKQELHETRRANKYLKSQLNEINLLNSKLLYTNKIFKQFSLNDGQKLRVVEALDNAENVKEAKLVFNTLKESFIVSKPKRSIKEGFGLASKAAGKSTANKAVITESSEMIDRFQKLANINN